MGVHHVAAVAALRRLVFLDCRGGAGGENLVDAVRGDGLGVDLQTARRGNQRDAADPVNRPRIDGAEGIERDAGDAGRQRDVAEEAENDSVADVDCRRGCRQRRGREDRAGPQKSVGGRDRRSPSAVGTAAADRAAGLDAAEA